MQPSTKYRSIPTVFERDPDNRYKTLIKGKWATPELEYLNELEWIWTEKVDGTNVRVQWNPEAEQVWFEGRNEKSQIPPFLAERLEGLFPAEKFVKKYPHHDLGMTLYGEGYGNRIQKFGHSYIPDGVDFILFDVLVGGWWLQRKDIEDIAQVLGIKAVPVIGKGSLWEAIRYAQRGFTSHLADTARAEGLVMRPAVDLLTRGRERIICKVKERDF